MKNCLIPNQKRPFGAHSLYQLRGSNPARAKAPMNDKFVRRHRVRNSLTASACAWLLTFCAVLSLAHTSWAATLTWTGGSFFSANWSDSGNWDTETIPNNGDTLVFLSSQLQQSTSTNDLLGLTLNHLQFSGVGPSIVVGGNAFTLTNGIQQTYTFGGIYIYNNITLAGTDNVMDVENSGGQWSYLYLLGTLSGSVGVTKTGAGVMIYQGLGNNTYTGTTRVNNGWLQLNVGGAHAIGGPLVVGDGTGTTSPGVQWLQSIEIASSAVTVNLNGTLDLNNFNDLFNSLTLQGGTVQSGNGTLSMFGDVTVLGSSVSSLVSGKLQFDGGEHVVHVGHGSVLYDLDLAANINDQGGGLLFTNDVFTQTRVRLHGTNTFTGPLALDNLTLDVETPSALGATNSTTTVGGHGTLWLYNTVISNKSLIFADGATLFSQNGATWAGPIVLNGSLTIDCYPSGTILELDGPISGPGGFTKLDFGTLRLSGSSANTYGATTTVSEGTLELNKNSASGSAPAVPGSLVLTGGGMARLLQSWQMYSPARSSALTVTVYPYSSLDLAGWEDWIGPLTIEGGQITTGDSGLLYLTGDITVVSNSIAHSIISGNLGLYGYASTTTMTISNTGHWFSPDFVIAANLQSFNLNLITATGNGEIELAGTSNTFMAPFTVNGGDVWVDYSNSLGDTNYPVYVNPGGSLILERNAAVGLKPLQLNGEGYAFGALAAFGNNSWAGDIYLAGDSTISVFTNATLTLPGAISGPGSLSKTDRGTLVLAGSQSNSFWGTTYVQQGMLELTKTNAVAIPGAVTIGAGLDGPNGDILRTLQPNQLAQTSPVLITSSGLFDITLGSITRAGSIAGLGSVQMGSSMLMFGYDNSSTGYGGSISGTADLTKVGNGTWIYTGTGSYSGNFGINSGQVFVDGSLPSAAIFFYTGTTFGGGGSVGPITSGNGLLSVGDNGPGILNSGSLSLASGDTFLAYIAGTNPGTGYSQMSFSGGTISLGNAHLQLNMSVVGSTNAHYTLIHNPTLHVISGTFAGMAEGATVVANNGTHFSIAYHGGPTGNDVMLTQTSLATAPSLTGITHPTNGNVTITGTGAPNVSYHVQATTGLAAPNWVNLGPVTANNLGALVFTDSQAALYPERFYRFVYP